MWVKLRYSAAWHDCWLCLDISVMTTEHLSFKLTLTYCVLYLYLLYILIITVLYICWLCTAQLSVSWQEMYSACNTVHFHYNRQMQVNIRKPSLTDALISSTNNSTKTENTCGCYLFTVSSCDYCTCDRALWPLILKTFKYDLDRVKENHHAKHRGQKSFCSKVIIRETDTHTAVQLHYPASKVVGKKET